MWVNIPFTSNGFFLIWPKILQRILHITVLFWGHSRSLFPNKNSTITKYEFTDVNKGTVTTVNTILVSIKRNRWASVKILVSAIIIHLKRKVFND